MVHAIFIPVIVIMLFVNYATLFRDNAKKQYEKGFIPGPSDEKAYIRQFKIVTVTVLLLSITTYITLIIVKL